MSDLKELSQSQVPLDRVSPLNSNRLVTFVNHFVVSIVQQLNEMSSVVDSRLFDISNQMERCAANLIILEMKLNSISGLSSVPSVVTTDNDQNINQINNINNSSPQTTQTNDSNCVQQLSENEGTDNSTKTEAPNEMTKTEETEESEVIEEKESKPEDPRIAKYKKMLQLGIPLQAVQQKMQMEGVDPELLSA